jgi:hypothetical protein
LCGRKGHTKENCYTNQNKKQVTFTQSAMRKPLNTQRQAYQNSRAVGVTTPRVNLEIVNAAHQGKDFCGQCATAHSPNKGTKCVRIMTISADCLPLMVVPEQPVSRQEIIPSALEMGGTRQNEAAFRFETSDPLMLEPAPICQKTIGHLISLNKVAVIVKNDTGCETNLMAAQALRYIEQRSPHPIHRLRNRTVRLASWSRTNDITLNTRVELFMQASNSIILTLF